MLAFYLALIDEKEDQEKFEKIYYKYKLLMFSTAKNIFGDVRIAEDAVQEAFIKIAKAVKQIDDVDSHKTRNFTVIITRNTCFDILEKEKRHKGLVSFEEIKDFDAAVSFDLSSIDRKEILEAINKLHDEDRDIVLMKFYYNFKEKEIAEFFGLSYQAARKRMQRAKEKLAKYLIKEGY